MAAPLRYQHYEVLAREDGSPFELGRGAMGITYKAFDTNLRSHVALKVINAIYLGSDVARQRFLREARAAAAIRHPNVATVFHLGEVDDSYFYAMEFIDGETVEDFMRRVGAIATVEALEIAEQVARALGAAEKQGLVHRDIKPSNIMLVREHDDLHVQVIDFGLAKAIAGRADEAPTLTLGGFLGTPHFASPEQLDERELDVRSDIYSLGVTLYYMLAGKVPFSGSLAQVISQHLNRELPVADVARQPPEVIALLRRMMAKNPDERIATPAELRREIERCLAAIRAHRSGLPGGAAAPVDAGGGMDETATAEPVASSALEIAPGMRLAERFELLEEAVPEELGRTYRARNLETDAIVAVSVLRPELLLTSQAYTRLENEVTALQGVRHPAAMRIETLEHAHHLSWISREWVEGPSLLDEMRSRGPLSLDETLAILTSLAGGLDAVQRAGVPCPRLAAAHIVLVPTADGRVQPKFHPLAVEAPASALAGAPSGAEGGAGRDETFVDSPTGRLRSRGAFAGRRGGEFVFALATIAYEMLGGMRASDPAKSFVPVASLPAEANLILRQALDPRQGFASAVAFVARLSEEIGENARPEREPREPMGSTVGLPPMAPGEGSRALGPALIVTVGLLAALALLLWWGAPRLARVAEAGRVESVESAEQTDGADGAGPEAAAASPTSGGLPPGAEPTPAPPSVSDRVLVAEEAEARGDWDTAFLAYLAAAEAGDVESMERVGSAYAAGRGTAQSWPQAIAWFERAAAQGNAEAAYALGECYYYGKGVGEKNLAVAFDYLETAAQDYDHARAKTLLGDLYYYGDLGARNPAEAFRLYSEAASAGFLDAQAKRGLMLFNGEASAGAGDAAGAAVPGSPDYARAAELFRDGAERGNPLSRYYYGMALLNGTGVPERDPAAAREQFLLAARAGEKLAQRWCRENGVDYESVPAAGLPIPASSPAAAPPSEPMPAMP